MLLITLITISNNFLIMNFNRNLLKNFLKLQQLLLSLRKLCSKRRMLGLISQICKAMGGLIFYQMSSEQLVDEVVYFRVVVYSHTRTALRGIASPAKISPSANRRSLTSVLARHLFFSSCLESVFQAGTNVTKPKKF